MNILHISRTMHQGGAEKVVYQICKDSKENNMYIASTGGAYVKMLEPHGVKHFVIPDIDGKNPFNMFKTIKILLNIVKENNIEIIHSHHRMAAFYSRIICIFYKKIKRVYTAHNVFNDKIFLTKFALNKSKIIAVGNGVKDNLLNVYGLNNEDIEIIYNSIEKPDKITVPDDTLIRNKKDKIFIGIIGRICEQKGMDIFVNALAPLIYKNPNIYGFIIGDGEDKENLKTLVKRLKIENNIIFLGYRQDIFNLISSMDFIVLPSRWEGLPLTPIETFSVGKTIIVSNISGNNEIVKENYNGLLFEKDNVEDLTKKINTLLVASNRKPLEIQAIKTYEENYSYESFIQKYNALYKKLF